jgi:hypothetical protein
MKRIINSLAVVLSITGLSTSVLQAQMSRLHGDDHETRMGIHAGNLYRTSFFNDGTFGGRIGQAPEVAGEWPINSGHFYVIDGNPMVLSEVADTTGKLIHLISENKSMNISQTRGPRDPVTGEWWTFLPLPGFAADNLTTTQRIAMAKGAAEWPDSWPPFWPDIADPKNPYKIYSADGWAGSWNGYFGRNVFNADEESYFVADDYNQKEFLFFPDSNDHQRRGSGLRMFCRGFQWAKTAVEDGMFILYDFQNIGTYSHEKMCFGFKIGNNMGDCATGGDAADDRAGYDRDIDLTYMWDDGCDPADMPRPSCACCGGTGWGPDPVGFLGGAFLESPGNPYDGIDNDNDGRNGPGPTITEAMFQPMTLNLNDKIVLIDYNDPKYPRTVTTLADTLAKLGKSSQDTLEVYFGKHPLPFKFWAGKTMQEFGDNLFDDNLNGLIDESRGQMDQDSVWHYLYIGPDGVGYKYKDYLTGDGLSNLMIDERRDDGIDNDGDWNPISDDVGADGVGPGGSGYTGPDLGEGDGMPTPGEPHFDKTDIDESDMIGLTSFYLYDWSEVMQYDPEDMWRGLAPGTFWYRYPGAANIELLFGSGYFPLVPGTVERFSMGLVLGYDKADLLRNKDYFKEAYGQNYNFAKAPYVPTVRAVAGDNKVTLFWNNFAESSVDPISGEDFEGYKIYRSTDPGWNDCAPITNGYGSVIFRQPLAQFDVDDDYSGFAITPTQGVQFYLGKNTGLKHYFVDTTAVNGYTYYYAVTSYDRGDPVRGIDPSECTKFVALQASGEIEKGSNVVVVKPEAPSAGYVPPKVGEGGFTPGPDNTADGSISLKTYDPGQVKNNHTYQITFVEKDTTAASGATKQTGGFTLVDKTSGDTLVNNQSIVGGTEGLPIVDGFQLAFSGNPIFLGIDTSASSASGWSGKGIPAYTFQPFQRISNRPVSVTPSGNYEIIFAETGIDTSKPYLRGTTLLPGIPVNFTIINTITNKKVAFAFREIDTTRGGPGVFSFNLTRRQSDEIIFLQLDDTVAGWWVRFSITSPTQPDTSLPQPGDVLTLNLNHPFLSNDTYEFTMVAAVVNNEVAKTDMDRIRVVPNPYIITNSWEPQNPYTTGRGERQLHFTHLPQLCTIKIFNVRGQLVKTLEHYTPALEDGTEIWNMLSKDNLEISYGIYIYHVTAPGVGERTGKFVVMK